MKLNKLYLALIAVLAVLSAACSSDDDYQWATVPDGTQVYFSSELASKVDLSSSSTTYSIPIQRYVTSANGGAVTVSLDVTNEGGLIQVPTSVSFSGTAQSEAYVETSYIELTYDPDALGYDNYQDITITISDAYTTDYGSSSYTVSVGIPAPWKSLGVGYYREDFLTTFYSVGNQVYEVEIQENENTPGVYRLVNPYGEAYPWNDPGDWDDSQDWYLEIHAEDPTAVYIETQETGLDWGYGNVIVSSMAGYRMAQGYTLEQVKELGYTGTLENGIITFPIQTLLICMPNYSSSLYYANTNGMFAVALPGYTLSDYTLEVAYGGTYTNANDETAGVLATVSEMGEDISSVRLAVVEGTDVDAAAEGIEDGSISYTTVTTTGTVLVPFDSEPTDGKYTIVAVGYNDSEAVATASATFKYTAPSSDTWTALYVGTYSYNGEDCFFSGDDPGLTLYRNDNDATRYKIEHWGYDVDFIFTMQSDGTIVVDDQETGYEHSSYGMVMVDDLTDYTGGTKYGYSYYDSSTGTFYFAVVYYVSAGVFGYGYETFTLTGNAASAKGMAVNKSSAVKTQKQTLNGLPKSLLRTAPIASPVRIR